jgi:hypothetical protein
VSAEIPSRRLDIHLVSLTLGHILYLLCSLCIVLFMISYVIVLWTFFSYGLFHISHVVVSWIVLAMNCFIFMDYISTRPDKNYFLN